MDSKVVVITGASSGIGAALAKHLGKQGYFLALGARRKDELKQVAEQSGTKALPVVTDVTKRKDMEHLRDAAIKEFGHIDIWVNNAGRGIGKRVMDLSDEDFDTIISVNLKSVFYGMQTIIPHFQQRGKGHLINISSFLGRVPYVPFTSIYSAAKSAVNTLTTHIRNDLKQTYPDIHVTLVMPGIVSTNFSQNAVGARPAGSPERRVIKEKPQTAEEVAAVIVSAIEKPVDEIYSRPELAELAKFYYSDLKTFEEMMK